MVLKPDPIFAAVEDILASNGNEIANHDDVANPAGELPAEVSGTAKPPRVILMCPQGETFTQKKAEELSQEDHLVFICGHYEGYDERIREFLVTDELSIGDYVLTGGAAGDGCHRFCSPITSGCTRQ